MIADGELAAGGLTGSGARGRGADTLLVMVVGVMMVTLARR